MTQLVDKKFGFRKTTDDTGKVIPAPEPLNLKLALFNWEDIIAMIAAESKREPIKNAKGEEEPNKVKEMVIDCINTPIINYVKDLIDTVGVEEVRAKGIEPELYSFELIANLPPASKSMFDEETWKAFKEDYMEVMAIVGVSPERAKIGAEHLAARLNRVKGNLEALEQFKGRINSWYSNSKKQEEFAKVFQYLLQRCEDFIKANQPETILASF